MVGNSATDSYGAPRAVRGGARETSMRRGVEALLALTSEPAIARGGLGVTRISELLGREKSQVSRTLATLARYGLVDRDPDTLAYRLGWRIYAMANLAGERRLLDAAGPLLTGLVDRFEERAHLSVLQGTRAMTVASQQAPRAVQAVGWVGRTTPAYCTSAGRALLMDASREELEELFRQTTFERLAPNTPRGVAALARRVAAAQRQGFATAIEELEPGLVAAAAPVRAATGRIVAAVNVSGPSFRFGSRLDEAGVALVGVGERLSAALRGDGPAQ